MYCQQCGAENEASAKFCKNCGQVLVADVLTNISVSSGSKNVYYTLMFWSGLFVVIGFFLPWISWMGFLTYNGWNVSSLLLQAGTFNDKISFDTTLYSVLLYLIPISAAVVIIMLVIQSRSNAIKLFKLLPFLIILGLTVWIILKSEGMIPSEVFRFLGIGYYVINISSILLAFSPIPKKEID